jgi:hypothetical protein
MRVFKNGWFARFTRKEAISDESYVRPPSRLKQETTMPIWVRGYQTASSQTRRRAVRRLSGYPVLQVRGTGIFPVRLCQIQQGQYRPDETKEFKKLEKVLFAMTDAQLELMLKHDDFDELPYKGGYDHDEKL